MKKTVIFLVGLIFSAFELNAFAQIDAEIKIDNDNSVVHADVALKPGQRGVCLTAAVKNQNSDIVFLWQDYTDESGKASFEYKNNDENGTYTVEISAPRLSEETEESFYVLSESRKNEIISACRNAVINHDAAALGEIMRQYKEPLYLDYEMVDSENDVYNFMAADSEAEISSIKSVRDAFFGAVIAVRLKEKKSANDYLYFLNSDKYDVLNKNNIPLGKKESLFDEAETELRSKIISFAVQKDYKSSNALSKSLEFFTLKCLLENANQWTEVYPLLKKYAESGFLNISFSTYDRLKNKDYVCAELMGEENAYSSYRDIEEVFSRAVLNAEAGNDSKNPDPGRGGGSGGGGGGKGGGYIAFGDIKSEAQKQTEDELKKEAEKLNPFSDMEGFLWANEAVGYLFEKGIISGKGDGKFAPGDYLTREEICKIAVSALKLNTDNGERIFSDVDESCWSFKYVSAAYKENIMLGVSENIFDKNSYINRYQLAVIIDRIMDNIGNKPEKSAVDIPYDDEKDFPEWAKSSVVYMKNTGIMLAGTKNSFWGEKNVNRAYACDVLYKALKAAGYETEENK